MKHIQFKLGPIRVQISYGTPATTVKHMKATQIVGTIPYSSLDNKPLIDEARREVQRWVKKNIKPEALKQ